MFYKTDIFIEKATITHGFKYDYSKVIFVDMKTKIIVVCRIHGDFEQYPHLHLKGSGCHKCTALKMSLERRMTKENFIDKAKKIHGDRYEYSKVVYINNNTKVTITCPAHGDFEQQPSNHLLGKGCLKCGFEATGKKLSGNKDDFILRARETHGDKYDYRDSVYLGTHVKMKIKCHLHGYFHQHPANHLKGHGCPICGFKKTTDITRTTDEEFKKRSFLIHGDRYCYDDVFYIKSDIKVKIKCNTCRFYFFQRPSAHLRGQGCYLCKESRGERLISDILRSENINFVREYRLPETNTKYRYDFWLPDHNLLIEFHGIQHYKALDFFGGEEALKENKFRDSIKKTLAKETGRFLIYFNYFQIKNKNLFSFKELVLSQINKIKCIYQGRS